MKIVFVLRVGDYRPDLCRFTLQTIQHYARRIGAEYREIDKREFPDYPVTYEKLQVHRLGAEADWSVLIDADTMVHPDMPDVTLRDPTVVHFASGHDMRHHFEPNPYFLRCGHTQAIASGFIATSRLTHDLWKPLPMELAEALKQTKRAWILDEYALTYNLAKYGLRFSGVMRPDLLDKYLVHIGSEGKLPDQQKADVTRAEQLAISWGII